MAHTPTSAVTDRWIGEGTPPDDSIIATLIDDAEDVILAAIPDLEARLADGRIPLERLQRIVARMVIRHLKNPQGYRQMQETVGPFTRGFTHGGDEPGSLFLSSSERRELLGGREGRAFQIDTVPAGAPFRRRWDAEWVP